MSVVSGIKEFCIAEMVMSIDYMKYSHKIPIDLTIANCAIFVLGMSMTTLTIALVPLQLSYYGFVSMKSDSVAALRVSSQIQTVLLIGTIAGLILGACVAYRHYMYPLAYKNKI